MQGNPWMCVRDGTSPTEHGVSLKHCHYKKGKYTNKYKHRDENEVREGSTFSTETETAKIEVLCHLWKRQKLNAGFPVWGSSSLSCCTHRAPVHFPEKVCPKFSSWFILLHGEPLKQSNCLLFATHREEKKSSKKKKLHRMNKHRMNHLLIISHHLQLRGKSILRTPSLLPTL